MKRKITTVVLIAILAAGAIAQGGENFTGDDRIVQKAEASREALSAFWFGKSFPTWGAPCPIVTQKAASVSGRTSFIFDRGEVFGWKMKVGGRTFEEIIDTAVPHEVNHTVFASELRRPLPRWLDEGAALYVENEAEHNRQRLYLR